MLVLLILAVGFGSWWIAGWLVNHKSSLALLDHPNARSLHEVPVPRTGGVAIVCGAMLGILAAMLLQIVPNADWADEAGLLGWSPLTWILLLTVILACVSLMDDRVGLPVVVRLGIQLAAGLVLIIGSGISITTIPIPMFGVVTLGSASTILSLIVLVWTTNLYNFMDGMDGFAGGMTVAAGAGLAWFAWHGHQESIAVIAVFLAGAAAGFLVHNFPPAKIFMGDVGSIPIGFLLGSVMLLGCRDRLFDVWVPLILLSPFIVDATLTLIRRALHGEKIWEAHRSHYYQRVVLLGWGHRRTVLGEYLLMAVCAGLALAYQQGTDSVRFAVLVVWGLIFGGLVAAVTWAERGGSRKHAVAG